MKQYYRIIIISIIALLIVYVILAKNHSAKEIRKLNKQLSEKVDSLAIIGEKYDSISIKYDTIYNRLILRKEQLESLKNGIDSIMRSNISSLRSLENSISALLEKQKEYPEIDTTNDSWRF